MVGLRPREIKNSVPWTKGLVSSLLAGTVALPLMLPGMQLAFAANEVTDNTDTVAEEIVGTTAAGSYLAAQFANTEHDYKLASDLLEDALRFEPDEVALKKSLMTTLLQAGEFERASELAEPFAREEGVGRLARQVLFVDDMKAHRYTAALGTLNIEKPTPNMAVEILMDRLLTAWSLMGQDKTDEAIELMTLPPEFAWYPIFTHYHAGLMLELAGRPDEAKSRYAATIEFPRATATAAETVFRAMEALIRVQTTAGELDDARIALSEGRRLVSNHPPFVAFQDILDNATGPVPMQPLVDSAQKGAAEVFFVLGKALDREGSEMFVNQLYQLGMALTPGHDPLRLAVGSLLENVERYADANAIYAELDDDSPYANLAQIQTAFNLNAMEETDASIDAMRQAVAVAPDNQVATIALASILMGADRNQEAVEALSAAIDLEREAGRLDRNDWLLLYRRGMANDQIDEWSAAEADFLEALELFPDQPQVLNYLGYTWIDMGINLDRGLKMLERAVEMRPNTGYIIDSLGWAHYRLENYDEAVRYLEEAVLLVPTDPTIIDHLGDAYWQVGRKLEARYKWGQALEQGPETEARIKIVEKLREGLKVNFMRKAETDATSESTAQ
ncbi:MAG: tetratricopeptide repeat protein [Pseudomonadota bacterium]